jgi:hypothetical protein
VVGAGLFNVSERGNAFSRGRSIGSVHAPAEGIWATGYVQRVGYKKIVPMQCIELVQNLADKDGRVLEPVKLARRRNFP